MKENIKREKEHAIANGQVHNGIPYIKVEVDGGWCMRSYGHGYRAKSGVVSFTLALAVSRRAPGTP